MKSLRTFLAILFTLSAMIFTAGLANAAPAAHSTCSGGSIASGTYASLTVTGACSIPDGAHVTVNGPVTVTPGAMLNAISASTVRVTGNVLVKRGATLGLGCSESMTMPPFPGGPVFCTGVSHDQVDGNIVAAWARTMFIDAVTIHGNLVSIGGGVPVTGADPAGCEERPGALNFPVKDNTIDGNVVITGWQGCWLGYIRNVQHGSTVLAHNNTASDDSMEVVTNTIHGNLVCTRNAPAPQVGDSGGAPNAVTGAKTGQCAKL
ncbi:hypothetical protein [Specibacter cremeus]|uniref:hypothetical protein n=1 Tax=Specibacter cremeus TaxID=1629051 RepID=UPI000F7671D9|nr:hypothetical protein [Specibacter cremeus]